MIGFFALFQCEIKLIHQTVNIALFIQLYLGYQ